MARPPVAKAEALSEQSHQDALRWLLLKHFGTGFTTMLEVGVYCGRTPSTLLPIMPMLHYIGVDPWLPWGEEPGYQILINARQEALRVAAQHPIRMRLLDVPSTVAATYLGDGSLDLVFIDAGHRYEPVHADMLAWKPKVRPGGVLCGHDYQFQQGVGPAVRDALGFEPQYIGGDADVWWTVIG